MRQVTEPRFSIGQQFTSSGKYPRLSTVVDVLKTYNAAGLLVGVCYVTEHVFLGRQVRRFDVLDIEIAKGIRR